MIPSGVKVFLASHPIDFRKGLDSLLSLVRNAGSDPFNGALYVFRAKLADRIKIVWWDGSGVEAVGKGAILLAAHWLQPGPAQLCPASGFGGWPSCSNKPNHLSSSPLRPMETARSSASRRTISLSVTSFASSIIPTM